MSWQEYGPGNGPKEGNRVKIALYALGIVVGFIVVFVVIVNLANHTAKVHKTLANSANTTTSAAPGADNSTTSVYDTTPTSLDSKHEDLQSPQGLTFTPAQLARFYPQSNSDLTDAEFQKAAQVATAFVTADTTGQGVASFATYYSGGYVNRPWVSNYNVQWVYANEDVTGVIHATVWFTGISQVDASTLHQVTQDVYLDKTNGDAVLHPLDLYAKGVSVDLTKCCVTIQ